MKILMVASEAHPFAKSGGLADVVSSLSIALNKLGHDVRVFMPRYYSINTQDLEKIPHSLGIPLGNSESWNGVYTANLPNSKVPVYFLDNEGFYGRDGIYGPPGDSFPDNAERFINLSKGALQFCKYLNWYPDIIHTHDWPTAIMPILLSTHEFNSYFSKTATVLTIHNLGYQGWFPQDKWNLFNLMYARMFDFGIEKNCSLNFLKCGILTSDALTTVSPTYSKEILTPQSGFGLDSDLRYRQSSLYGILNGIDYSEWNPKTDKLIKYNYSVKSLSGKAKMKTLVQKNFGLQVDSKVPLIGIVSRFAEQKGFGALLGPCYGRLYDMLKDFKIQVVVTGSGDKWISDELISLKSKLDNLGIFIGFSNKLAHEIEAGSDLFLMPSAYEPCGLNQLYSLSYGTLPIVRNTGGLADTVENYNEKTGEGTGFVFNDLTPNAIYNTVGWAVSTYYDRKEHFNKMIQNAMSKSFSWEKSAKEYEDVYLKAFNNHKIYRDLT